MASRRLAPAVALVGLLLAASSARPEKVFRYNGPRGTPSYSNVYPGGAGPVEVRQLAVGELASRIQARFEEGILYVANRFAGPAQVLIEPGSTSNAACRPPLPAEVLVPGQKEVAALRVSAADPSQGIHVDVRLRATPGDPNAQHRPEGGYALPFSRGRAFRVSQGFHGTETHSAPENEYAVDIAMPEGTPICAARAGMVMDVADDFFEHGRDPERYGRRANFIRILHDDGTMALYAHLALESIRVSLGARVGRGQVIASSGNTGYSSGPHLHFAVEKNHGMRLGSVPFSFEDGSGRAVQPSRGVLLSH